MRLWLMLATAAAIAVPASSATLPSPKPSDAESADVGASVAPPTPVRLPGFAAVLAQGAPLDRPSDWAVIDDKVAWRALAAAKGTDRQQARWDYARSLIGRGRGAEAAGVLDVMVADDPDLALVDAWRIAHGAALTLMGRGRDAADALGGTIANNPEACAWRLRAASDAGDGGEALRSLACARPALGARPRSLGAPFILAAAHAAIDAGRPELAIDWLSQLPDRDNQANLYRGRAYGAMGKGSEARLRFARVTQSGDMAQRMDARVGTIEAGVANHWIQPDAAIAQLGKLRYVWRGGDVERRALMLEYRLAGERGNLDDALRTGATLYRFHDPASLDPAFLPGLQAKLSSALEPDSKVPLVQAAGMFWDYRDLMPGGAEGDLMVSKFGTRLQSAGLYQRAAELFEHQLLVRAVDLAQGPLSVRVATLYILAGRPDRALMAMRKSSAVEYPATMLVARKRVEAVALSQLGRTAEAFAVLQDVPDAAAIRAEIAWKQRDWDQVASATAAELPRSTALNDVDQAIILRRAVALAMLGRESELAALRTRYAKAFAPLPNREVFALLTAQAGQVDPTAVAKAMAAMPSASPAGDIGALLYAGK